MSTTPTTVASSWSTAHKLFLFATMQGSPQCHKPGASPPQPASLASSSILGIRSRLKPRFPKRQTTHLMFHSFDKHVSLSISDMYLQP